MISIVVPVFKAEKSLRNCIDSILFQSYENWELILVDDGSPDDCGAICDGYVAKDNRIRALHQKNSGVSVARNNGICMAKGDYITFVDSDDYLAPTFLSRFDLDADAEIQVVGMTNIYSDGSTSALEPEKTEVLTVNDTLAKQSNIQFFMSPWAKLYKMSVIKDNGLMFPTDICYTEDEIFVKKCLSFSKHIRTIACSDYKYTHFNENSLASRHYSSDQLQKCLDTDAMEFHNLLRRLGKLPEAYVRFCTRRKSYLFHRLASTIIMEGGNSERLMNLCQTYDYLLDFKGDLPRTYLIERFCLKYLPMNMAIAILKHFLR